MAGIPGRLCASEQLSVLREYPHMIRGLCAEGLSLDDASALAYNATLLFYALPHSPPLSGPEEALRRYSLGEIAQLCEIQERVQSGAAEYGEASGEKTK